MKVLTPLIPALTAMADRSDGELSTTESISGGSIDSSHFVEADGQSETASPQAEASVERSEIAQNASEISVETNVNMAATRPAQSSHSPNVWNANMSSTNENATAAALDIRSMLSEFSNRIEVSQQQIRDSMITETKLRDVMQTEVLVPLQESIKKADDRISKIEADHGKKIEAHEKAISETNKQLQSTITRLNSQIESIKKSAASSTNKSINPALIARQNNLVIAGITEATPSGTEDLEEKVKAIATELDCTLSTIKTRRLGKLDANKPDKIRHVLVEFSSHWEKRKFYSARNKLQDTTDYKEVYFNEDLDKQTAMLYYKGRSARKAGRIKSCWTYGCQVFFSRHGSAEPILLTDEKQLPPPTTAEEVTPQTPAEGQSAASTSPGPQ